MSLPRHISTTIGSEFTLMAAQARPTSANTTYMIGWIEVYIVVSR